MKKTIQFSVDISEVGETKKVDLQGVLSEYMTVMAKASKEELACPYRNNVTDECMVSFRLFKLGALVRLRHCNTANYDDCPLFLARTARRESVLDYRFRR